MLCNRADLAKIQDLCYFGFPQHIIAGRKIVSASASGQTKFTFLLDLRKFVVEMHYYILVKKKELW